MHIGFFFNWTLRQTEFSLSLSVFSHCTPVRQDFLVPGLGGCANALLKLTPILKLLLSLLSLLQLCRWERGERWLYKKQQQQKKQQVKLEERKWGESRGTSSGMAVYRIALQRWTQYTPLKVLNGVMKYPNLTVTTKIQEHA